MATGTNGIATRDDCNTIYQTFSSDLTKCVTYKEVNESGNLVAGCKIITTAETTLLATVTGGSLTSTSSEISTLSTDTVDAKTTLSIPYMSIPVNVTLNCPLPLAAASSGKVNVYIYLYLNGVQIASGQSSTNVSFAANFQGTQNASVTVTINSADYFVFANRQNLTAKMTVTTNVCYIKSASATIPAKTFKAINKTNNLVKYSEIRSKSYTYGVCTSFSDNTAYNLQQAFGYSDTGSRLMQMDCSISPSSSFSPVATGSRTNYLDVDGAGPGCQKPKTYDSDTVPKFYWKFTVTFPDFYELNADVSAVQYRLNYKITTGDGTVLKNTYTSRAISVNGSSTSGNSYWTGTGGSFTDSGNFTTNTVGGAVVNFEAWISNVSRTSASGGGGGSSSSRIGVWE